MGKSISYFNKVGSMGSVVKGPLRALVNREIVYKGVMENPSC
jgi:hypothetical protein